MSDSRAHAHNLTIFFAIGHLLFILSFSVGIPIHFLGRISALYDLYLDAVGGYTNFGLFSRDFPQQIEILLQGIDEEGHSHPIDFSSGNREIAIRLSNIYDQFLEIESIEIDAERQVMREKLANHLVTFYFPQKSAF